MRRATLAAPLLALAPGALAQTPYDVQMDHAGRITSAMTRAGRV